MTYTFPPEESQEDILHRVYEVGHARLDTWRGLAQLSVPEQIQESPLLLIAFVIGQLFFSYCCARN